jgi:hypothetical protein
VKMSPDDSRSAPSCLNKTFIRFDLASSTQDEGDVVSQMRFSVDG